MRDVLAGTRAPSRVRTLRFEHIRDLVDLHCPANPERTGQLKARSDLLSALSDRVKAWELPRSAAARRLGITPARLDDALRGKLGRFSRDDLVGLTAAAEAA